MYSIVLMASVAGSPAAPGADTPAAVAAAPVVVHGCVGACHGYGCGAVVSHSCYGSCYGRGYGCGAAVAMPAYRYSCYGASCMGTSCYGSACYGSCYGSSCYGAACYGGCTGEAAAPKKHGFLGIRDRMNSRRAGSSKSAGCYGASCYGGCYGSACYGSCYGSCYGTVVSYGCSGHVYGGGCYGAVYSGHAYGSVHTGVVGETVTGGAAGGAVMPMPEKKKDEKGKDEKPKNEEGANIKFQLPAGAKLYVDGRLTAGEGTERAFFTPPLAAGQKYFYDVKAELVVDGKTVTEERRVVVQAGAELRETFPKLMAAAGNPANVATK